MDTEPKTQWAASVVAEDGFGDMFDTREAAIAEVVSALDLVEGCAIYVGIATRPSLRIIGPVQWMFQEVMEDAEWPECVADAVSAVLNDEGKLSLAQAMQDAFDAWAAANNLFGNAFIVDPHQHLVTAEEAAASKV